MDEDLDYLGYNNTDSVRPNSRRELHQNIEKYELIDIYRELTQRVKKKLGVPGTRVGKEQTRRQG